MSKQTKAKARQRHNRRVVNMRKNNGVEGYTTGEMRRGFHLARHMWLLEQRRKHARVAMQAA